MGRPLTIEEFFAKATRLDNGCWVIPSKKRYLGLHFHGKWWQAHRLSWALTKGPIPPDMNVLHNCPTGDNSRCINPNHLWLGTQDDNVKDSVKKGTHRGAPGSTNASVLYPERRPRGERQHSARLTAAAVLEIRSAYASGHFTLGELGAKYGVTAPAIRKVVLKRSWAHVQAA